MIRLAWYAVDWRANITSKPQRFHIAGEDLVLYEAAADELRAFGAWCPHRGCDLSLATVEADCLTCAYHGWQFDADGACVKIPANKGNFNIPKRFALKRFAVQECAGLVYVCVGDAANAVADATAAPPPTFQLFPELADDTFDGPTVSATWDAHFSRVVESVMDVSHLPFVHPETTGDDCDPAVTGPDLELTANGLVVYPTPFAASHPLEPVPAPAIGGARTEIELIFPNHWIIRTPLGTNHFFVTYLTFTPIADNRTAIFGLALRNFEIDSEFLDVFHLDHTEFVMKQDQDIVERLHPKQAPFDLQEECHVASDAPTIHFRKLLREAVKREAWDS